MPPIHRLAHTDHHSARSGPPTHIVLHHALCWSVEQAVAVLSRTRTSTHYVIDVDGSIHQLCDDDRKAWHCWSQQGFWNDRAIGVDLVNPLSPKHAAKAAAKGWPELVADPRFGLGQPKRHIPDSIPALRSAYALCAALATRHGFELSVAPAGVWDPRGAAERWSVVAHATVSEHRRTGRRNRWDGWATLAGWERLAPPAA